MLAFITTLRIFFYSTSYWLHMVTFTAIVNLENLSFFPLKKNRIKTVIECNLKKLKLHFSKSLLAKTENLKQRFKSSIHGTSIGHISTGLKTSKYKKSKHFINDDQNVFLLSRSSNASSRKLNLTPLLFS